LLGGTGEQVFCQYFSKKSVQGWLEQDLLLESLKSFRRLLDEEAGFSASAKKLQKLYLSLLYRRQIP